MKIDYGRCPHEGRNPSWRGASIALISVASDERMKEQTEAYLHRLLPSLRIRADIRVVLRQKEVSIAELINAESAQADAVFLGLADPPEGEELAYAARLFEIGGKLDTLFFVKNSSLFVGHLLSD